MFKLRILIAALLLSVLTTVSAAQENASVPTPSDSDQERLASSSLSYINSDDSIQYRRLGLSPEAAKVYRKDSGFTATGYLEMRYEHFAANNNIGAPSGLGNELGVARGVLFLGYRFSDRLLVNSEFRFDRDLVDSRTGKFNVDSAYVDYKLNDSLFFRGGILLLPTGLVNEFHGPEEYLGTNRPLPDTYTIPTVWHGLGFGIAGTHSILDYRFYLVNGFNAGGFTVNGPRDGREISWDTIKTPAIVGRVDFHLFHGGMLGGSYYWGKTGAYGTPVPYDYKHKTTVMEAHFEFKAAGWVARAQYAKLDLDRSEYLNAALGTTGYDGVGSRMVGGNVEGGYDFWARRENGTRLMPYMRVEVDNPQDALPKASVDLGLLKNLEVDHTVYTYGVEVAPIPQLLIKSDYQFVHAEGVDTGVNQFNISAAYFF